MKKNYGTENITKKSYNRYKPFFPHYGLEVLDTESFFKVVFSKIAFKQNLFDI